MLLCNDTVTLVKCDGTAYAATVLDGVSWYDKTRISVEGAGLRYANATSVRIPSAAIACADATPEVGDHLIHGLLPTGIRIARPADLAPYSPRKVLSVGDNRRGRNPHLVVICQ